MSSSQIKNVVLGGCQGGDQLEGGWLCPRRSQLNLITYEHCLCLFEETNVTNVTRMKQGKLVKYALKFHLLD